MTRTLLLIMMPLLLSTCRKTPAEREVREWRGTWEIVSITGAGAVSATADNPFGKIMVFEDGTGELHLKNYKYTDKDEQIVLSFVLHPDRETAHVSLNNLARVEKTAAGYRYYTGAGAFPCKNGSFTLYIRGELFGNNRKRTCEVQSFPECVFTPVGGSKIVWELRRTSKK